MLTDSEIEHLELRGQGFNQWTKVKIKDFGTGISETIVCNYETFSEITEDEFLESVSRTIRGEGDAVASRIVSARRAKSKVRQLCKMLKAKYMITLTTRKPIFERAELSLLYKRLVYRLKAAGIDFQYVAGIERHDSEKTNPLHRGAYHLHIAVSERQDYKLLINLWNSVTGGGYVRVTGSKKGQTLKQAIGMIAAYISKYISKEVEFSPINAKSYWASRGIGKPLIKVIIVPRLADYGQQLLFALQEIENFVGNCCITATWQKKEDNFAWICT